MTTLSTIITRLTELEAKATKGPWQRAKTPDGIDDSNGHPFLDCRMPDDAEFLVLLRNALPALLAERQALREALESVPSIDHPCIAKIDAALNITNKPLP